MKTCTKCKVEKPFDAYTRRKNPYKTTTIYYHQWCNTCLGVAATAWREANREKYNSYQKEYHKKKKVIS